MTPSRSEAASTIAACLRSLGTSTATLVVIEVPGDIDGVRVVLNDDSGSWQAAGGEAIEQSGSDAGEGNRDDVWDGPRSCAGCGLPK